MFTVLFSVSSGGQSYRLSGLVGEVWVVCCYLFVCGLLYLSLSCMDQVGIFCYIYTFTCNHHHHHHISVMELGHLLTSSGLMYPEVSSKVCHDSFCQLGNSVSLPWVILLITYLYIIFLVYCSIYLRTWEGGVLWFSRTVEDCPRLFTVVFV
jgi:hypothetical protein